MSKLEFFAKSQEYDQTGRASGTKVMLGTADGGLLPVFLPPDVIDLSNSELYELAMDKLYQDNFPQRFEREKFIEYEQALNTLKEVTERAEAGTVSNKAAVDNAILEMTELVANIYADIFTKLQAFAQQAGIELPDGEEGAEYE